MIRRKSIFYVLNVPRSLNFVSGQLKLLNERGWEVAISCNDLKTGKLNKFSRSENAVAIPLGIEREINLLSDLKILIQLIKQIRKFRPLVTNVGTPKAGLLGGIAAILCRVPLRIYTLHGLRLETSTGLKRVVLELMERLAMACAHKVICVSPSLRSRVIELGLASPRKVIVIGRGSSNGIRPALKKDNGAGIDRRSISLKEEDFIIGFVGRLTRDKGVDDLIYVYRGLLSEVPNAKILIVGEFEDGDPVKADTRQFIEENPEKIIRINFVEDPYPYYSLMDVFAFPTHREGLGLVPLEAALHGVPSIVSDCTGAKDTVIDGRTGWIIETGNTQQLRLAMLSAFDFPEERIRRGKNAMNWVEENYNRDIVNNQWVEYFEKSLHRLI